MASISDVFDALNDIKGKLDTLHTDATNNGVKIDATNNKLDDLKTTLAARLTDLIAQQQLSNQLLHHLTLQQETVICILEHISRNTCNLVNLGYSQLQATKAIREQTRVSSEILRSAYPDAALELKRMDDMVAKIERCCPPEPESVPCTYEPCKDHGPFQNQPKDDDKKKG